MTAFWRRPLPTTADAGIRPPAVAGRPVAAADSVVIGRFRGTVVVTLHGDLDRGLATGLASTLHDLIEGQGNLAIVVDLRDVPLIDCSGVDVLVAAADRIETRGGEMRLGGPTGAAFDSLALSGLARLIDIPFEQDHRPWSSERRSASARRQASITSHPAGMGRHRLGPPDLR